MPSGFSYGSGDCLLSQFYSFQKYICLICVLTRRCHKCRCNCQCKTRTWMLVTNIIWLSLLFDGLSYVFWEIKKEKWLISFSIMTSNVYFWIFKEYRSQSPAPLCICCLVKFNRICSKNILTRLFLIVFSSYSEKCALIILYLKYTYCCVYMWCIATILLTT